MKLRKYQCVAVGLLLVAVGCTQTDNSQSEVDATVTSETTDTSVPVVKMPADEASDPEASGSGTSVPLTPENTSIQFVGNHTGDDPDPRTGSFQEFSGTAVIQDKTLHSISVDIDATSVTTEVDKLTNHLKSADFFDVNRYPTAKFQSTEILDNGDGTVQITGELTLLDQTNTVTFPATVRAGGEPSLQAEFEIDRTRWGMDYGLDKIEKQVEMTIKIGA